MLLVVEVKVSPMCLLDETEFTSLCFWIELLQFLTRHKYNSLESSYEFCVVCSVQVKAAFFLILVALENFG
jgi:hypothetical protein